MENCNVTDLGELDVFIFGQKKLKISEAKQKLKNISRNSNVNSTVDILSKDVRVLAFDSITYDREKHAHNLIQSLDRVRFDRK